MTRNLLLMTVALTALGTGAAFSQTQTDQTQSGQQPAAQNEQQPAAQGQGAGTQEPAAEGQATGQQTTTTEAQVVQQEQADSECTARMEAVSGGEFFTGADARYREYLPVLSDLRDSAMQLEAQNLDEACLKVVEAMEIAIENFQGAAPGTMAARGEFTREQIEQRLVAVDASEMPINTAEMEGVDLYSLDGEDIGNVEGFLMAQGRPTHMIVSHGGFWDIGDADIAIPLDIVKWDPEWQTFFAPLTDEQMDEAPDYDAGAWDTNANDQFYQAFRG